tara:strand:- start:214 stop:369 length:156 start_codon:yes stop_codon:yes gene_type:complete
MKQPQEAIFIKFVKSNEAKLAKAKKVKSNIDQKLEKFELPSGPALINGRWW